MSEVFEWALIRVVPRVDRGEAINAGVIVYSKSFRLGSQTPKYSLNLSPRLRSHLFYIGLVFEQRIPNVPCRGQQNAAIIMVEDGNNPHITQRFVVERDPP